MAKKPNPERIKGPSTPTERESSGNIKERKPVRSERIEDRTLRTGPGGMNMRELHERVKQSHQRDQAAGKPMNKLTQPQNRWQRFVRYVWDKNKR